MKVRALIELLEGLDAEADVYYTWESIGGSVEPDAIYLAKDGQVIIDCDENFYQKKIQKNGATWISDHPKAPTSAEKGQDHG